MIGGWSREQEHVSVVRLSSHESKIYLSVEYIRFKCLAIVYHWGSPRLYSPELQICRFSLIDLFLYSVCESPASSWLFYENKSYSALQLEWCVTGFLVG